MTVQFKNFASTQTAGALLPGTTSIPVTTGSGGNFPTLGASQWFYCVLTDSLTTPTLQEVIKVTARSGDTFTTVVRAQDGTTALNWPSGTYCQLRLNQGAITDLMTQSAQVANNLSDLASAGTARTNLGLGSMATQNASAVAITGGTIDDVTLGESLFTDNVEFQGGVDFTTASQVIDISPTGSGSVVINPAGASFMDNVIIGNSVPKDATVTQLTATGTVDLSPTDLNVTISPGGVGVLTVSPNSPSSIDNTTIGVTTPLAGKFTTLTATAAVSLSPPANVTIAPTGGGTVTISPAVAGTIDKMAIGGTTPAAGAFTTLSSTGNTTVGDAAGDTLTINAGTWSYGSNWAATRAVGVAAAGAQQLGLYTFTFSGNAAGTSDVKGQLVNTTTSGANAFAAVRSMFNTMTLGASAGVTTEANGQANVAIISGAGTVGTMNNYRSEVRITSTGGATTVQNYLAASPTLSSTGAITTHYGYQAQDLGHATLVTNAIGFQANDQTASVTLAAGFRSSVNSGTAKWGFYAVGTADNAFAGNVRIGSVVAPTVALDVTGAVKVSQSISTTAPVTETAATHAVATTTNYLICNRAGTITVTLPAAASFTGRCINIQTYTANTVVSNASNVVPQGGGAAATAILAATAGKWADLVSDGTNWVIVRSN